MLGGTLFGANIPEKPEHAGLLPFVSAVIIIVIINETMNKESNRNHKIQYNHTHEPEYVVQTGKRNMDDVAKIIAYGVERSTDWPIGDDLQHCNNGSFGLLLPFHDPDFSISSIVADHCFQKER